MRKFYKVRMLTLLAFIMSLGGNMYLLNSLAKLRHSLDDSADLLERPTDELKQRRTVMAIDSLLIQINLYASLTGKPPQTIDILQAPLDADGPGWPLDCYGKRIEYNVNTNCATLVSAGLDGVFGNDDDIVGRLSLNCTLREIEISSPVGNWFSASTDCCDGTLNLQHSLDTSGFNWE